MIRSLFVALVVVTGGCAPDAGPVFVADDPDPARLAQPGPLARAVEPAPVAVGVWMTAHFSPSFGRDPVFPRVQDGTLTMPREGTDDDGVYWLGITPDEEGSLGPVGRGTMWAVTTVSAERATGLLIQPDRVLDLWVNGRRQPGDVYGSGRIRVPFALQEGDNLVVARILGGRGAPTLRLWTTPHELHFNLADRTHPDLLVGDASTQYLGVPMLAFGAAPITDVRAMVVESDAFEETALHVPVIPAGAVTQVPFQLVPKAAFTTPEETVSVTLRVESSAVFTYEVTTELSTVAADGAAYRRTFRSGMDRSAQYYGVRPPASVDPARDYGLILSLHGASVEAAGQARAYSSKDWAFIVAATNRRPFGFDWEDWGRLDGLEVLEDARAHFGTEPTRTHVTGHSMGGHGTWQLGSLFPGLFAVAAPSAGWASFYSYTGRARPTGPFARAQASSDTYAYLSNLQRRSVYVVHGDADDNVPVRESRDLVAMLESMAVDVTYHEEPGAGHWWNGDRAEGADCVDWPEIFSLMEARTLETTELDFDFISPSPFVSPTHSYVTLHSAITPDEDLTLRSRRAGDVVTLTTGNVRSMVVDGGALSASGVRTLELDGATMAVEDGPMRVGPETGKRLGQHGPFNDALVRPFCFVYEGDAYRDYASWLVSTWSVRGNGAACALPASAWTDALAAQLQPVYLGVRPDDAAVPFTWSGDAIELEGRRWEGAAVAVVYPEGDHVAAYMATAPGREHLLYSIQPFASGSSLPDFFVWSDEGGHAAGFFDAEWGVDPTLAAGL